MMEGQETFPSSKEEADKHIASRVRAPIDGSNDIVAEDRECLENLLSLYVTTVVFYLRS
jgi:hypothetical protein